MEYLYLELSELSEQIREEVFPHLKKSEWETDFSYWRQSFGYKIKKMELGEEEAEKDIEMDFLHTGDVIRVGVNRRVNKPLEKKVIEQIFHRVVAFLKRKNFTGFLVFKPYHETQNFVKERNRQAAMPFGNEARRIQKLSTVLGHYFHYEERFGDYHIRYSAKAERKKYKISLVKKYGDYAIAVHLSKKESLVFREEQQIKDFYEKIHKETKKAQQFVTEFAATLKKYDAHSVYIQEKEAIVFLNEYVPMFAQYLFNGSYRGRIFYQTIEEKDFDVFKEKIMKCATDYIKKHRLKLLMKRGAMDNYQKMYLTVFHKHSKKAREMLKKSIVTSLTDRELDALVHSEIDKEVVMLSDASVASFKEKNKIRQVLKGGFTLGNMTIYRSATRAYIEKN